MENNFLNIMIFENEVVWMRYLDIYGYKIFIEYLLMLKKIKKTYMIITQTFAVNIINSELGF